MIDGHSPTFLTPDGRRVPKPGLAGVAGDVTLADIGIPAFVFERAGVEYAWPYGADVTVALRAGADE